MNIHVIEQLNNFVKLPDNKWESGWWSLDENKAQKLVGGVIYFHKKRNEPSFLVVQLQAIALIKAQKIRAKLFSRSNIT